MKPSSILLVILFTISCTVPTQLNYSNMTNEELAAFNLTVSESEQVYCVRTQRSGVAKYITRKTCGTTQEIKHLLGRTYTLPTDSQNSFFSMDRYRNRGGPTQ